MLRREALLTWGLIALCLLLTGINLLPRLAVQRAPVVQSQPDITVAVSGAVLQPGSYTLAWGARVEDAIDAAGGFHPQADRNLVNLAAPLDAGDAVFVPSQRADTGEARVSINSATLDELDTLPGIGPALARRIVEGRPYSSIEDLLDVPGIGPVRLEDLRDKVTL